MEQMMEQMIAAEKAATKLGDTLVPIINEAADNKMTALREEVMDIQDSLDRIARQLLELAQQMENGE